MHDTSTGELARTILEYWFAALDDRTALDRETEPFRTCFSRWYGKRPEIDDEIRARFQPALTAVTRDGASWDTRLAAWRRQPKGLLALVILLDQLPRNMFRDTPAMYEHDPLALTVTTLAIGACEDAELSLVERMFLYVPLMHVENVTLQLGSGVVGRRKGRKSSQRQTNGKRRTRIADAVTLIAAPARNSGSAAFTAA